VACAALLVLAGGCSRVLSPRDNGAVFPAPPARDYSLSLGLGAASSIVNVIVLGMFIGHLALFGLAGIGLAPHADKGKTASGWQACHGLVSHVSA